MRVSVITVTYNSGKTITDTLRSVKEQSYPDIEHIVIDGGSTDQTASIVSGFKEILFLSEKDEGIYDALNKGLRRTTGALVVILHSDDVFANKDVLRHAVEALQKSGADALYGDLDYVSEDLSRTIRKWRSGSYHREKFLNGWMPPHPTFILRKSCYEKFGVFNTEFKLAADYELMLRMLFKNRISCTYLPEVMVKMRVGGVSNARIKNRVQANLEDRKAWEVNGLKPRWYTLTLKPLRKIFQYL